MSVGPNLNEKRLRLLLVGGVVLFLLEPFLLLVSYLSGNSINGGQIYFASLFLSAALICWGALYQFRYEQPYPRVVLIGRYILLIGIVAFLIGYIGPIIFSPEANQGPLLGIFYTGPIGALIGGFLGIAYLAICGENEKSTDQAT